MSETVIEARGLTKRYRRAVAVDHIDLTVQSGEVIGLLGPNGSGKTTTILMLLGLTEPSEGTVRILGLDPLRQPLKVKSQVGYLPDSVGFYDAMSGRENLAYTARLAGIPTSEARDRIDAALARVRLSDVADRRTPTYSHGMKQRLGLAELLMRDVRVAILDEPTSGLDPQSTQELLLLIQRLSGEGMTFVLSSHMLDVVQSVCNRVALFNKGRVGFFGTVDELAAKIVGNAFVVDIDAENVDVEGALSGIDGLIALRRISEGKWQTEASRDLRPDVAKRIVEGGGNLRQIASSRARLGELYGRYFKEVHDAA